jgi:hypothetical protein
MINRLTIFVIQALTLVLLISINATAQDRAALEREMGALREQLNQKEAEFLAPSAGDRAAFADFLRQPNTGLARLMPREAYRDKLNVREGGAYYSFAKLSNNYDDNPQIGFEQGKLHTGFAGANFGFLCSLGDVPLEGVGLESEAVQYLAEFAAPTAEPSAREQSRKIGQGFAIGNHFYIGYLPATVGHTYILRSISYRESDLLIAFRIVRKDTDGSVVILWKKLKEFPIPFLASER